MPANGFSMGQLLMFEPGVPFKAKEALQAAAEAKNVRLAEAWRRRAAFLLGERFGLDECEQAELVDLEPDCGCAKAA